ncbi:MAG: FHA domain-containing protein [Actinomycetota bacterium]
MEGFAANVVPGQGAVARWGVGVVVAGGPGTTGLDLVAELSARLGAEPAVGPLIEALRTDPRFGTAAVNLAAAVPTADGVRVFVRGGAQVRTQTNELITGTVPIERELPGATAVWLGLVDPPTVQGHPAMDLVLGVVTGDGVVLHRPVPTSPVDQSVDPTLAAPEPAPVPVEPDPLPVAEFEAIDWGASSSTGTREPLPVLTRSEELESVPTMEVSVEQVMGIRCSRGHFNHPDAGFCQVCGISMVHLTHRLEPGPRPTLGFMVFADGATYALDRSYLIGRSPKPASGSRLTALPTQDATQSVSREHAELRLDGWDVVYTDLGSTNGSFLWDPNAGRWNPITPRNPLTLTSGARVSVGRMTFVFEAASRAVGGHDGR